MVLAHVGYMGCGITTSTLPGCIAFQLTPSCLQLPTRPTTPDRPPHTGVTYGVDCVPQTYLEVWAWIPAKLLMEAGILWRGGSQPLQEGNQARWTMVALSTVWRQFWRLFLATAGAGLYLSLPRKPPNLRELALVLSCTALQGSYM